VGALTHFPCKLRLKFFSPPWGDAGAPTAPPGYAMVIIIIKSFAVDQNVTAYKTRVTILRKR